MSILIKMEMPKNCEECFFRQMCWHDTNPTGGKLPWCPLIELPPHGRLVDADALMKDGWKLQKQVMRMGGYAIHEKPLNYPDIPTIIEAEGEE